MWSKSPIVTCKIREIPLDFKLACTVSSKIIMDLRIMAVFILVNALKDNWSCICRFGTCSMCPVPTVHRVCPSG